MTKKLFLGLMAIIFLISIPNVTFSAEWWDKFGTPQYGGTLTVRDSGGNFANWDPAELFGWGAFHWESLFYRDWVVDRQIFDFKTEMAPIKYYKGGLAESWERTDPKTVIVHLRKGAKWQNKEPVNGREITADDVVYTYDRILGTGNGFTKPNPMLAFNISNVERVVCVDKYTVKFVLKNDAALALYQVFDGGFFSIAIVAPEMVQKDTLKDWKSAAGTGPWVLKDFVSASSASYVKNPDYYGVDERHPQNRIPYIDNLRVLIIPDIATTLAALRSGKIDLFEGMNAITLKQAEALAESNPEIQQSSWPTPGQTLELRVDKKPFTDIRVRKALQLAVNIKAIAEEYYNGAMSGDPQGMIAPIFAEDGWTLSYSEWPKDLQEEYSYNPEKAKQLLAEAGYPNGFKTNIIAQPGGEDIQLLQVIKSYFKEINVDMEIKMFTDMASKETFARAGKMDQMTYTNTTGHPRAPFQIITFRLPHSRNGENYTFCDDPQYTTLVDKALAANTMEDCKKYISDASIYALRQHWTVNILGTVSPIAWQPWVKGNSGEQLVSGAGFYYARWWIDQNLKK